MVRTLKISLADAQPISRLSSKVTISVSVNLGAENGKPLGTLFQLKRATNPDAPVAALGVPQFFNHYVRNNTRMLHAHARKTDTAFTVTELGTPRTDNPRYHVFVLDGVLIDGTNRQYYDDATNTWLNLPNPWFGNTLAAGEQVNYANRVNGQVFIVTDKGVHFNGAKIINYAGPTYKPSNGTVLFYDGLLFASWDDGVIRTYAWTPGAAVGAPINSFNLIATHFLRAMAVVGGVVYAVSGYGRLIRYDRVSNAWSYVTQSESVLEFYCAMVVNGTLRLGDYPNGDQWILNSGTLERFPNYPPEEAGAGPNVREIQAMTMYGGDQVLPLFPWGYVHKLSASTGAWSYQRLYTAPAVNTSEGPYVNEFGNGDWRQRIPCAGLYKDGAFMVGSNTPGNLQAANFGSVSNLPEYGRVWLLKRPHAFSRELDWKSGTTVFKLEISSAGLVLSQDDVVLGTGAGISPSEFEGTDPITIQVGEGIYGPFGGNIIGSLIQQEF